MSASRFIKCVTVGDGAVGKTCLLISYTSKHFPPYDVIVTCELQFPLTQKCFFQPCKEVAGYGTQVVDLGGKVVVPGFTDSHMHFIYGGLQMMQVGLRGVNEKDEVIRRIKDAVQSKP